MNLVQPIRDAEAVRALESRLEAKKGQRAERMYLLLMLGVYLGLRVSDLIRLRVGDLRGKEVLRIREQKTGKSAQLPIPDKLRRVCRERLKGIAEDAYILRSRQRDADGEPRPITRKSAYNDVQAMGGIAGLSEPLGCHSLRKTFGYHYYKQTGDIAFLMVWFNHSSAEITKRYIGIDLDERAKKIKRFEI